MTAWFNLGYVGAGEQGFESRIPAGKRLELEGRKIKVAAVADADLQRAQWVADQLKVPAAFGSVEEMLGLVPLDGLIVALPPAAHAEVTLQALARGIHVLCEKPFGRSAREAEQMIEAAEFNNRVLATGYQYPVQAGWSLQFASLGGIGTTYLLDAKWMRSVSASDRGIPDRPGFWNTPGGRGVGADLGSHLLSVGLPMLGSRPVAVTAAGWSHHGRAVHGGDFRVEDTFDVTVDCANNARGHFTAAWAASVPADVVRISCWGSGGSLEVPLMMAELDPEPFRPKVVGPVGELSRGERPIPTEEAFVVQQRNFIAACRGEEPLLERPQDAVSVHRVLDGAYESIRRGGERVTI